MWASMCRPCEPTRVGEPSPEDALNSCRAHLAYTRDSGIMLTVGGIKCPYVLRVSLLGTRSMLLLHQDHKENSETTVANQSPVGGPTHTGLFAVTEK